MNKLDCAVIKDLLPLYVDDVCSEKSKDLIEEHLAICEDCQKYYEALQENLPEITLDSTKNISKSDFTREIELIKKVSRKIKKKTTINGVAIGLICFIILVSLIISSSVYSYNTFYFIPALDHRLEISDIQITEVYEQENGDIYFTLESDERICWPYMTALTYDEYLGDDTEYYASIEPTYSWWSDHIEHVGYVHSISCVYPTESLGYTSDDYKKPCEISSIYCIGKKGERLTIWDSTQEVEKAPEDIEERVALERMDSDYGGQGFALFNFE